MTGYSFTTPAWEGGEWVVPAVSEVRAAPKVNGPEDRPRKQDAPAAWDKIGWRAQQGQVRRLRQRIFKAAQEQDWPRRYFGAFNKFRNDRWVFGDRDGGTYLVKFSWTGITRHVMVKGRASPMTRPWPATGPNGARRSNPRLTITPCGC
jgi:hypothetical protein